MRPTKQTPPWRVHGTIAAYVAWFRRNVFRNKTAFERFEGVQEGQTMAEVPQRLKSGIPSTDEIYLRQHERADWKLVDPHVQVFAATLIERCRRMEIPMYVHTARRTAEQQAELAKQGRSKVRGPVAAHTVGYAVDIVHSHFHWEMSRTEWKLIGAIGESVARDLGLRMKWGGDWKFYDPAHWELLGWQNEPYMPSSDPKMPKTPRKILREYKGLV